MVSWTTAIKSFHEARDWAKALGWLGDMEAEVRLTHPPTHLFFSSSSTYPFIHP